MPKVLKAINLKFFSNDKDEIAGLFSFTMSNITPIFIKNRIDNASNSYEMSMCIFFFLLSYALMTNWIFQLLRKDFDYATKSQSISRSIMHFKNWFFEIWSNMLLTSIIRYRLAFFKTIFLALYTLTLPQH